MDRKKRKGKKIRKIKGTISENVVSNIAGEYSRKEGKTLSNRVK